MVTQVIQIRNWEHFVNTISIDFKSDVYRNAEEVYQALVDEVMEKGAIDQLLIPYKCKPDLSEGDCIFDLISKNEEFVIYDFATTVS